MDHLDQLVDDLTPEETGHFLGSLTSFTFCLALVGISLAYNSPSVLGMAMGAYVVGSLQSVWWIFSHWRRG